MTERTPEPRNPHEDAAAAADDARTLGRRSFLHKTGLASAGLASAGFLVPKTAAAQSSIDPLTALGSSVFGSSVAGSSLSSAPGVSKDRPAITHGVASGDMTTDGAMVWTRSDRPANMVVTASAFEDLRDAKEFRAPAPLTPSTDFTGRVRVRGMKPGTTVYYSVQLEDTVTGAKSEPVRGTFRTAPSASQDIRFHWSGDVAGQGYGINPEIGGMIGWKAMADRDPHFFLHSGDVIYADNPIEEKVTLDDGRVWHNITSEATSKVAETLDEFRGNYAYNLLDENYRAFNAKVPQLVQWDDHETRNNWYPGQILDDPKYTEKRVDVLSQRSFQAFTEWQPIDRQMAADGRVYRKISYGPLLDVFILDMRTYKDANTNHTADEREPGWIFGEEQRKWLVNSVKESTATWKVIANDLPLGIVVPDGDNAQEAVSSGTPGEPVGREQELAAVLSALKNETNLVWLTADVHYCAAHEYHPDRAAFQDFSPFWEFVTGPLNAGAFGPNKMDDTFGPRVDFVHGPDYQNQSPLDDVQHFGEVEINAKSKQLTVRLITTRGNVLYTKTLDAA